MNGLSVRGRRWWFIASDSTTHSSNFSTTVSQWPIGVTLRYDIKLWDKTYHVRRCLYDSQDVSVLYTQTDQIPFVQTWWIGHELVNVEYELVAWEHCCPDEKPYFMVVVDANKSVPWSLLLPYVTFSLCSKKCTVNSATFNSRYLLTIFPASCTPRDCKYFTEGKLLVGCGGTNL